MSRPIHASRIGAHYRYFAGSTRVKHGAEKRIKDRCSQMCDDGQVVYFAIKITF